VSNAAAIADPRGLRACLAEDVDASGDACGLATANRARVFAARPASPKNEWSPSLDRATTRVLPTRDVSLY